MRGLTLWQPWASFMLVVPERPKRNETRGWSTTYRGPLGIHAAKREPGWVRDAFCDPGPLRDLLLQHVHGLHNLVEAGSVSAEQVFDSLPRGCILGRADLVDCIAVEEMGSMRLSQSDWDLGDYSRGRFAWVTRNAHRLVEPIRCRGAQGLWSLLDLALEGPHEWVGQVEAADA